MNYDTLLAISNGALMCENNCLHRCNLNTIKLQSVSAYATYNQ